MQRRAITIMSRLKEKYNKEIISEMIKEFGYKNKLSVPKIEKVVINVGFGKDISGKGGSEQERIQKSILDDLATISGQAPSLNSAKKSIAGFKIRKGNPVGCSVILRKKRMYDFIDRLISVSLPRVRDFSGIKISSFDKKGNLNMGIKEHIIFPEIYAEKARNIFGLEITVVNTSKSKEEGIKLLQLIGFPIKKNG